jgi:hypothetical protein
MSFAEEHPHGNCRRACLLRQPHCSAKTLPCKPPVCHKLQTASACVRWVDACGKVWRRPRDCRCVAVREMQQSWQGCTGTIAQARVPALVKAPSLRRVRLRDNREYGYSLRALRCSDELQSRRGLLVQGAAARPDSANKYPEAAISPSRCAARCAPTSCCDGLLVSRLSRE